MATVDIRIGASKDLKYRVGETFWGKLVIVDINNAHIDWTGATIGDMLIFKKVHTSPAITVSSEAFEVDEDGDIKFRVQDGIDLARATYKFRLPLTPAGGGPTGFFHGKLIAEDE